MMLILLGIGYLNHILYCDSLNDFLLNLLNLLECDIDGWTHNILNHFHLLSVFKCSELYLSINGCDYGLI